MTHEPPTTTVTTPADREIVFRRIVAAPQRLVFAAHTIPSHLERWLLGPEGWTMSLCEQDLRPGGAWRMAWRGPQGEELHIQGTYREVTPPERLVTTESWGGDWADSQNTTDFVEEQGHTTVTTTMRYPTKQARDRALATGMTDGMTKGYDRLDAYLRNL